MWGKSTSRCQASWQLYHRYSKYKQGKTIGSGSSGKVHLGLHVVTGEKVAIKIIEKKKLK